jgi:hypothetical protein
MGMLLQFSPKVPRSRPAPPVCGPAEVILFTGVRYERGAVANTPKPTSGLKRTRKG